MRYGLAESIAAVLALLLPSLSQGHGGGLDASGCHTNRKTGDYHCHRSPAVPSPPPANAPPSDKHEGQSVLPQDGPAVYFKNCSQARSAGAAPIRRGEPGYGSHLDRDGDGIACE
jgi:hypothetical protein